ncbi:MAG: A24 family peptidase [Chloroflexi bacterium]|nr:A24 family peptidase [Chloroflexota bacterium]MCY4110415.1 A24 family peptidase [Chloroflexota bacterium]
MNPGLIGLSVALGVALLASITDIRERRIPNTLIVTGLVATSALAVVGGWWVDALAGSGLGMVLLALPRLVARDAVGLGDIKLAGVLGIGTGMVVIVVAIGIAVVAAMPVFLWCRPKAGCHRVLPFAPFLATGVAGHMAMRLAVGGG